MAWADFYRELSGKLIEYKEDQTEYIEKVKQIYPISNTNLAILKKICNKGNIDPFTFFALFNSKFTDENRKAILEAIAELFSIEAQAPTDFDGIPLLPPTNLVFYPNSDHEENDVQVLWEMFDAALEYANNHTQENIDRLLSLFSQAKDFKRNGISKVTMGLYWVAPECYLSLDDCNIKYIYNSKAIPDDVVNSLPVFQKNMSANDYLNIINVLQTYLNSADSELNNFIELSIAAWNYDHADTNQDNDLRALFIKFCKKSTVKKAQRQYEGGIRAIENEFNVNVDNEYDFDKCSSLCRRIKEYLNSVNPEDLGNKRNWISYVNKYVEFRDSLISVSQKDESKGQEPEKKDVVLKYDTNVDIPYKRNRVVFGAPGTGKSFKLKEDCKTVVSLYDGEYTRVTFHPDYSYSQFVGTYKPVSYSNGEKIKYEFVPGPFMRVLVDALKSALSNEPKPFILLIEEINRAKVAAVFGDVFQLLDRDGEYGSSEYEIQTSMDIRNYLSRPDVLGGNAENYKVIKIPNNMYIWATMNSADQGVYPMDTAFKRRWSFEYIGIDNNEKRIAGKCLANIPGCEEPVEWNALRKAINAKMTSADFRINEDKLLGPYFISRKIIEQSDSKAFIEEFISKVIMYLYEDAVKQKKYNFFDGCPEPSRYSSVCEFFKTNGLEIFGKSFKTEYYDKYKV